MKKQIKTIKILELFMKWTWKFHSALLTVYHSYVRVHLDYGDVICEHPENEGFSNKIEIV